MGSSTEMSGMQPRPRPGASNATQLPAPKRAPQNYLQKAFPMEKGLGRRSVPGQSTLSTRGEQEKDAPHSAQLGRAQHPLPGPRPVPKPWRDTATSSNRGKNPPKNPKSPKNSQKYWSRAKPRAWRAQHPQGGFGDGRGLPKPTAPGKEQNTNHQKLDSVLGRGLRSMVCVK